MGSAHKGVSLFILRKLIPGLYLTGYVKQGSDIYRFSLLKTIKAPDFCLVGDKTVCD